VMAELCLIRTARIVLPIEVVSGGAQGEEERPAVRAAWQPPALPSGY